MSKRKKLGECCDGMKLALYRSRNTKTGLGFAFSVSGGESLAYSFGKAKKDDEEFKKGSPYGDVTLVVVKTCPFCGGTL